MLIIGGDVGGTKTNAGLFDAALPDEHGRAAPRLLHQHSYASGAFGGLADIVADFGGLIGENLHRVQGVCFGIAGPVIDNHCTTPNLPWEVDGDALARRFEVPRFSLINDLVANAEGIGALLPEELAVIQQGKSPPDQKRPAALIAPGTGLGMAFLTPTSHGEWMALASEGGHADLAPRSALEIELLKWLMRRFPDHVSYERVVCGAGLVNIYEFLLDRGGVDANAEVREAVHADPKNGPRAISEAAHDERCATCTAAVDLFATVYGAMAGNLALLGLAAGGVFLGGGISPKIRWQLERGAFTQAFCDKGRLRSLMESMPVRLILNADTAMLGAARSAARDARATR
jgi:glucokinase